MIEAMIHGCYWNGRKSPTIIISSLWLSSKIKEKLVDLLVVLLDQAAGLGVVVYIFDDSKELYVLNPFPAKTN